jgi:heavy metal sensor kinase
VRHRWPVRVRLTVASTAGFALVLAVAGAASWWVVARATLQAIDSSLRDVSGAVAGALRTAYRQPRRPELEGRADTVAVSSVLREFRFRDLGLAVFADDPRTKAPAELVGADTASAAAQGLAGGGGWDRVAPLAQQVLVSGDTSWAVVPATMQGQPDERVIAVPLDAGRRRLVLLASVPLARRHATLESYRQTLLLAVPLSIAVAALLGYALARAALTPVDAMSSRARQMGAGSLHERFIDAGPADELGRLASTFNGLLDRLEASFDRQRQFTADASHELRGPVATVRGAAERALSHDGVDVAVMVDALRVVASESRRLSQVVDDLFLLARTDAGEQTVAARPGYLEEVVASSVDAATALAASRGIAIRFTPDAELPVFADEKLLRRLVMNLLDNAIKYTPDGGRVDVVARRDGSWAELDVCDTGPGIAHDERERIFERFYRVRGPSGASGVGDSTGAGLGLPIARWIAAAHGGTLEVVSGSATGATFRARVPLWTGVRESAERPAASPTLP